MAFRKTKRQQQRIQPGRNEEQWERTVRRGSVTLLKLISYFFSFLICYWETSEETASKWWAQEGRINIFQLLRQSQPLVRLCLPQPWLFYPINFLGLSRCINEDTGQKLSHEESTLQTSSLRQVGSGLVGKVHKFVWTMCVCVWLTCEICCNKYHQILRF